METTRHFTATVYVVCDGATLLHHHDRLDTWVPPGGHLDRDERPREAAVREVREETGLDVDLLEPRTTIDEPGARELPPAEHVVLYDVHRYEGGEVGHQHVDFVYYGEAPSRELSPERGERGVHHWEWFTTAELERRDELDADVVTLGLEAIEAVDAT